MSNTPEHAAAAGQIAIRDAMAPLEALAQQLEAGAAELLMATKAGDTAAVVVACEALTGLHLNFGRAVRRWQASRPDGVAWRSSVPGQRPAGGDAVDRMSC